MAAADRAFRLLCILAAALAAGCATSQAPPGWLGTADDAADDGLGGWAVVEFQAPTPAQDPPALGEYVSTADIPAQVRSGDSARVDFTIPAGAAFRLEGSRDAWLMVEYRDWRGWIEHGELRNMRSRALAGECIAATNDTLYLLNGGELRAVPADAIRRAQVSIIDPWVEGLAYWTAIGTLSTVTHGFFFVLTAPSWLILGSISMIFQSREGKMFYPADPLADFSRYARFPQGLPPALRHAALGRSDETWGSP